MTVCFGYCQKFNEKRKKEMKPKRTQRKTLCTQNEFPHKEITSKIIVSAIEIHSKLGSGLLEGIYK